MSRILKVAVGIVATALVVGGAVVVYRETDLLTGSLVLLSGLMIAALLARRAAVREEREGMADWESETLQSAEAAEDLFGDWAISSPTEERARHEANPPAMSPAPSVAPPVPSHNHHRLLPPDARGRRGARAGRPVGCRLPSLRGEDDEPQDTEALVASLFVTDTPTSEPLPEDTDPFGVDPYISAPPEPAFVGAGAPMPVDQRSPIDWTGQGGRVDERVKSSDDILRVSEATALPGAAETGGSELARLLSKVEARLRDYRLIGVGAIACPAVAPPFTPPTVLVVGAGPAGSAAATTLARSGLAVTVVDKATFPGTRSAATGLTTAALRELDGLGLDPTAVASWIDIDDVVVRSPSGHQVTFPLPRDGGRYGAVARRRDLDAALVELARAAGGPRRSRVRPSGAPSRTPRA